MNNNTQPMIYDGRDARAKMKDMLDDVDRGLPVRIKRGKAHYTITATVASEDADKHEERQAHFAQLQVIRWLQSRCEDQMVRAWLSAERQLLDRMDYPVTASGTLLERERAA